ncbi:Rabankyrin-5 [Manis pentadactyla]|nr:Rabankyrin-5 [Manis pentadactyla]
MLSLDPSVEEEVGKRDLASARGQELEPCEVNDLPDLISSENNCRSYCWECSPRFSVEVIGGHRRSRTSC